MPADGRATLLLNFAGKSRMIAGNGTTHTIDIGAKLLGVHSQSYILEHEGDTDLIAAQFRPGGFAAFVRFAEVPHQSRIQHALAQIDRAQGNLSVQWLAAQANLSQKQFERLFERVVGMMPKRYIRLARFQKLVSWLRHCDRTVNWTNLAAKFGYYDHSHLAKDFQAFAGTTPGEFAAATAGIVEVAYGQADESQNV